MTPGSRRSLAAQLGAAATGLWMASGLMSPVAATAARSSATVVTNDVDAGTTDPAAGVAAWRAGSLTLTATRIADGRIKARVRATIVARRSFSAMIAVAPCNAYINPLSATPDVPVLSFAGPDVTSSQKLHKGVNRLDLIGTVSSDAVGAAAQRHWTDCVAGDVFDETESDAAALALNDGIRTREGSCAFCLVPAILTTTAQDGRPT